MYSPPFFSQLHKCTIHPETPRGYIFRGHVRDNGTFGHPNEVLFYSIAYWCTTHSTVGPWAIVSLYRIVEYQRCCYGYPSSSVCGETIETIHRLRDLSRNPKCTFSSSADGERAARAVNELTSPVAVLHFWLRPSQSRFVSTFCVSLQWPVSVMCVYLHWFLITRSVSHTAWLFCIIFAGRISCQQMSKWNWDSPATPTCTPTIFTLELPSMVKRKYSNWCKFNINAPRLPDELKKT